MNNSNYLSRTYSINIPILISLVWTMRKVSLLIDDQQIDFRLIFICHLQSIRNIRVLN